VSETATTVGGVLARLLQAAGVDAVYGASLPGVRVVEAPAGRVAGLLADAHRRVHGRPAATVDGRGVVAVTPPGRASAGSPMTATLGSAGDAPAALETLVAGVRGGLPVRLRLDVDLSAPAPDSRLPLPPPADLYLPIDDGVVALLSAAEAPMVLAGPGVVTDRAIPGLHAVAAAGSLGVLNTWGAKGVFDWRSRHHLATAGLQSHDFVLGGLGDADLIVATGVDPSEAPDDRWRLAPVVEVPPGALDPLAERWARPRAEIAVPPLRAGLARVTQEGWARTKAPLAPTKATQSYGVALGGGLVAADPGVAGYWVARTFATTEVGAVHVPADREAHGTAAACAAVARLRAPGRPVLAIVDARPDGSVHEVVAEVVAAAARLGIAVPVEAWHPEGAPLDAGEHLARLASLVHAEHQVTMTLATDPAQLGRAIDVAGEVIAWGGLPGTPR
jgi:hypothetical protein